MPKPKPSPAANPDRVALARTGERVRKRLAGDPAARRVPVEGVELYQVPGFLAGAECDRFIALVDAVAQPSKLYSTTYESGARTSYSGDVDPYDPFVGMITRRIDDLLGLDSRWGETVQGQRYLPGQEFKVHCDWFQPDSEPWIMESQRGGQRSWTAMIYLNEVEEGGATDFPYVHFSSPPQRGTLLTWNNATPEGEPNLMTMHAGTPVVRGTKYVITKWYRTRPWAPRG